MSNGSEIPLAEALFGNSSRRERKGAKDAEEEEEFLPRTTRTFH